MVRAGEGLDPAGGGGAQLVGGGGGGDEDADLVGPDAGRVGGGADGRRREVGGRLVGGGDVADADAGAFGDPLRGDPGGAGDLLVVPPPGGEVGAHAEDADGGFRTGAHVVLPRSVAGSGVPFVRTAVSSTSAAA